MSEETVSEKIDHRIRTGLAIAIFIAALYAASADLYCSYFDPSYLMFNAIFGVGVGMFTGAVVKVRYILPAFIGSLLSLIFTSHWYLNDRAEIWPLVTVGFMLFGTNLPLFWKLHKLQMTRQVIANSKTTIRNKTTQ